MDYKYIDQLLERYWRCETSLEEEEILRTFFSQQDLPAELKRYQALFAYEQKESKMGLGDDFDRRMMARIEESDGQAPVLRKRITLTTRLKPLFKAAAIVAIFLTLGNAMQATFSNGQTETIGSTESIKATSQGSVAMGDSASIDSMEQHNASIGQVTAPQGTATLLK